MATKSKITTATRSSLVQKTGFKNYDVCLNPYVGCEFGCSYCYVRFFVKDDDEDWGNFVRLRTYIPEKLPKELGRGYVKLPAGSVRELKGGKYINRKLYRNRSISELRLVIGTMTDPYQPQEKSKRLTRSTLEILLNHEHKFAKVGIFTRSPLVLQDLHLIKQLPRVRVHFTITPFSDGIMRALEPFAPVLETRWRAVEKLKEAGIRVHVNVAPIMPLLSEEYIDQFARRLAELNVDEYFVDPMQPYEQSFRAVQSAVTKYSNDLWPQIESTMSDRNKYLKWKDMYFLRWQESRAKYQHLAPSQLPIWSDHENHVWVNMITGGQMDFKNYNGE